MILLPSQLKNNSYIDVRLSLATGQDFIVLSKKKVLGTNATTVWLQLNELEINLMNNAIVESYIIQGAKLYAAPYVEAGMQKKSIPTYVASSQVVNTINRNPNIIEEAKAEYGASINELHEFRSLDIETSIDPTRDQRQTLVETGNADEIQAIKAARQQFVDSLDGTEDVGYTK